MRPLERGITTSAEVVEPGVSSRELLRQVREQHRPDLAASAPPWTTRSIELADTRVAPLVAERLAAWTVRLPGVRDDRGVTVLMSLAHRLRTSRLYLCTDARERQGDLEDFLRAAFAGGVDIVQIRQKNMAHDAELAALEVARRAAGPSQGIVCVNDSPRLAEAFASDMLHLGQTDGSARRARRHLHRWALVGRSTHTPEQADEALADPDVDYFAVGPVHATPTKPDYVPVGLELVRHAARVAPVAETGSKPWFAIGGLDADNLGQVVEAGARRVVVVRAITEAPDPEAAARVLKDRLAEAWSSDPALAAYALRSAALDA